MGGSISGFLMFHCGRIWIWPQISSIRWICLKGIPLPFWHDQLFVFIGPEFGCLVEISPLTSYKINLLKAWLEVEVQGDIGLFRNHFKISE